MKTVEGINALTHNGSHPEIYCDEIYMRLSNASSREEVINILEVIRQELSEGTFKYWGK